MFDLSSDLLPLLLRSFALLVVFGANFFDSVETNLRVAGVLLGLI